MTARSIAYTAAAGVALGGRATTACPNVTLEGDPAAIAAITAVLNPRAREDAGCEELRVRIERRDGALVVTRLDGGDRRVVAEAITAASLIESWTQDDFEAPLLRGHETSPPGPQALSAPTPIVLQAPPLPVAIELTAAMESSFANDQTSWVGAMIGTCVQVGRVCVSTRARFAAVVDGPGMWETAQRHSYELIVGGDIPFAIGNSTLMVGFGAGMGAVRTSATENGMAIGSETFGMRADAHVGWTFPMRRRLAFDVAATVDLAQVTDVESEHGGLANEPRMYARVAAGLRFGGP